MPKIACLCYALLIATSAGADTPGFRLGIDHSVALGFLGQNLSLPGQGPAIVLATDGSSSPYLLAYTSDTSLLPKAYTLGAASKASSFLLKETPDGKSTAYLAVLGFQASAMAVDSAGSAYVAGPDFVAKLNVGGSAFVYKFQIGAGLALASVAVDQKGRLYVAGNTVTGAIQATPGAFQQNPPNTLYKHAFVLRLNAAGTAIDYATYLAGLDDDIAWGIGVDASGSAVVSGTTYSIGFPTTPGAYSTVSDTTFGVAFLTRFTPDGSALVYSTLLGHGSTNPSSRQLGVDPNGNAAVGTSSVFLQRFNAAGALTFSKTVTLLSSVAMDSAGNVYINGYAPLANYAVKNNLATCGPAGHLAGYLTVFDSNGNLLQSTYLSAAPPVENGLVLGTSSVFVLGEDPQGLPFYLTQLSPDPNAQIVPLACVGNAATYASGPIAAGELVSLFGQGLGPDQGTQPRIDLKSGVPSQVANVRVTFNGIPAPLLYVQDSQINAVAPWSLAGAPTAEICVFYKSAETNCLQQPVAPTSPAVFTTDGLHAAALNQDGSINSAANPAMPGSTVSIFATGLGPLKLPPGDGSIVLPPFPTNADAIQVMSIISLPYISVTYEVPLPIQYAGPAPYQVAGISQINFSVADGGLAVQAGIESPVFLIYVSSSSATGNRM